MVVMVVVVAARSFSLLLACIIAMLAFLFVFAVSRSFELVPPCVAAAVRLIVEGEGASSLSSTPQPQPPARAPSYCANALVPEAIVTELTGNCK